MPAPFTSDLCGYRVNDRGGVTDKPNMSDANDPGSIELGRALLHQLGVPDDQKAPSDPGGGVEDKIVAHLKTLRPDLVIAKGRRAHDFVQYAHLDVLPQFLTAFKDLSPTVLKLGERLAEADLGRQRGRIEGDLQKLGTSIEEQAVLVSDLAEQMPEESLLKIDISVAIPREDGHDELAIALSSKWSLRTDRAQDCVSQGNKLVGLRRGRMPHFGVITIEPRPAMLRILADGSGAVDFVYHLDLPALTRAVDAVAARKRESWSPGQTFNRLMRQKRLRDFDDLVAEVMQVASPAR